MYCPCMGRFGNQAEQLLGALLFAKSLNRTLLLPPFIHYGIDHKIILEPFENVIKLEPLKEYHKVMLLSDFMQNKDLLSRIWPSESRSFFCYSSRANPNDRSTCGALKGEPFNSFWNKFNITKEENSIMYKPLSTSPSQANIWKKLYPSDDYPIITFVGAPSSFPAQREAIPIQKHIVLSDYVREKVIKFKREKGIEGKHYLSMHIRHGYDWRKACELLKRGDLEELFSSDQCTKYRDIESEHDILKDKLQFDTCLPRIETITTKLGDTLSIYKDNITIVHIATDFDDLKLYEILKARFPHIEFLITPRDPDTMISAMMDLYLMAHADVFIGNCVSSFSAFPARIRTEQLGLQESTYYFGQNFSHMTNKQEHDEL